MVPPLSSSRVVRAVAYFKPVRSATPALELPDIPDISVRVAMSASEIAVPAAMPSSASINARSAASGMVTAWSGSSAATVMSKVIDASSPAESVAV